MSHDVAFYDSQTMENVTICFEYMNGIFYRAFDAESLNRGVSGADETVTRTAAEVRTALEMIKAETGTEAGRLSMTIEAVEKWLNANPDGEMVIHFS